MTTFVCLRPDCGHAWTAKPDADGNYDGFGNPPCPQCDTPGTIRESVHYWECPEGHTWPGGSNGGLVFGKVPNCPTHGLAPVN